MPSKGKKMEPAKKHPKPEISDFSTWRKAGEAIAKAAEGGRDTPSDSSAAAKSSRYDSVFVGA